MQRVSNNTPLQTAKRGFRLQISLRMLLLLMLFVGVGLTIFRWPWVEEDRIPDPLSREPGIIERKITYRRNWRGKKIKNGLSQTFVENRLQSSEHFYKGEYHGSQRYYDRQGRLTIEKTYRHGQQHGLFRVGNGVTWMAEGSFANDRPHGEWKYLIERNDQFDWPYDSIGDGDTPSGLFPASDIAYASNPQTVIAQWQHGKRHGRWTWTPPGQVLRSAEYADDELVRWNNKPVVEQFWQWLRGPEVNDPQLVAEWTAGNQPGWISAYGNSGLRGLQFEVVDQHLTVHCDNVDFSYSPVLKPGGRLVPAICEMMARYDLQFAYRYGGLWMVRRREKETAFEDPTGISQIKFAAGSSAERDWIAAVDVSSSGEYAPKCIAHLLEGTSIEFEINGVLSPDFGYPTDVPTQRLFTRNRSDVLGYILYTTGCRCELQGQVLRILPQPERTSQQSTTKPLALNFDPFG
jgi:hypothetical protein